MPTWENYTPRNTSARTLAAWFNVVVGLRVLLPDNILGNPANSGYRLINQHFFGDGPFGLALLLYGMVLVIGLHTDRWPHSQHVVSWLSFVTWALVAYDIAVVSLSQMGSLVYALVACLNVYAYVHLMLRQRELDRAKR